jgi:hypothetical protein
MGLTFPDPGEGTCINCGFLSQWRDAHIGPPQYDEVSARKRADADFSYGGDIWCYVHAANLRQEVLEAGTGGYSPPAVKSVIERGRDCPSFYRWREGLSPRDHLLEREGLELERERRQFEERMEEDRRRFEKRLEEERREFDERLASRAEEAERQRYSWGFRIAVAAILLALAEILTGIFSASGDSIVGRLLGLD